MSRIKVVGVGGIGTALLPVLSRFLNFEGEGHRVTLVDGDEYEERNRSRQAFGRLGNKAKVKAEELAREFTNVSFRAIPEFVTKANVSSAVQDGDIIFLGVDNHRTRKVVSDHCETLSNVTLISGGNDLTDGNVQVFIRREGKNVTVPLTRFHPEIARPSDQNPGDVGCAERALLPASRQIIVTNLMIASWMLAAFWLIEQGHTERVGEFYADILEGKVQRIERKEMQ